MTATAPVQRRRPIHRIVRDALGAPPGPPPFRWHDRDQVARLADPLGLTVEGEERTLAFTAPSPEAYVDAEGESHPVAVMSRRILEQRGDPAALRAKLVAVLQEGNEDPTAFRATSRYVIWTMRPQ